MKKQNLFCALFLLTLALPLVLHATNPPAVKWTVKNPFEQKVFIENKGQYTLDNRVTSNDILFGARQGGLQYYFTKNSIWMKRDVAVKRTEEEIEQLQNNTEEKGVPEKDEKELQYKIVTEYHQVNFINANPLAQITSDNKVSWYYSFTPADKVPVKAQAYKKITYVNLYPGIDMEVYFKEDTTGYEYSFIVHPGADVSQLKMQYPLNKALQLNDDGNMTIQSAFGNFIDHAPVTNQLGNTIASSFSLSNSIVTFTIGNYDKTQDLVIDPWSLTPTFSGTNDGYDVDWDNAGNCYAYGGSSPWQLVKYNSTGVMQWSYTENFNSQLPYYGGMAIDKNSQSSYLIEGFNADNGSGVIKVNSLGTQVATFAGNQDFREMWRIAFSRCTNHAVIAGGGTSSPTYQVCYLDTDITNLSPVNALKTDFCCHDMWGIALDNNGNCYTATVTTASEDSFENVIIKMPLPSLIPTTWIVSDGYAFQEAASIQFNFGEEGPGNSFNGMAMSDTNLLTYDSHKLYKWGAANGQKLGSVIINTTIANTEMDWAGLTADDCGNIFLGDNSVINQYDINLNLKDTIHQPGAIYALNLGRNDILYAAGAGFISAIQVHLASCGVINVSKNVVQANCTTSGSVTVSPSGGTPPYNIVWNTNPPQTGPTATNLTSGTYIATITDNSCAGVVTAYDTVVINSSGNADLQVPTAFTPDKTGVNSIFMPNIFCSGPGGYEFEVFDRWGRQLFETTNPTIGWDGKYNGKPQPLDVYAYFVKFTCGTCNVFKKGDVTLVR